MISYEIYKITHIVGIVMLFMGLAGILLAFANSKSVSGKVKFVGFFSHGFGLFLVILGGFGMLARLGIHDFPGWIYGKIAIWLFFGFAISLSKRKANWALSLVILYAALAGTAAYLALLKPI